MNNKYRFYWNVRVPISSSPIIGVQDLTWSDFEAPDIFMSICAFENMYGRKDILKIEKL